MAEGYIYIMNTDTNGVFRIDKTASLGIAVSTYLSADAFYREKFHCISLSFAIQLDKYEERYCVLCDILRAYKICDKYYNIIDVSIVTNFLTSFDNSYIYPNSAIELLQSKLRDDSDNVRCTVNIQNGNLRLSASDELLDAGIVFLTIPSRVNKFQCYYDKIRFEIKVPSKYFNRFKYSLCCMEIRLQFLPTYSIVSGLFFLLTDEYIIVERSATLDLPAEAFLLAEITYSETMILGFPYKIQLDYTSKDKELGNKKIKTENLEQK